MNTQEVGHIVRYHRKRAGLTLHQCATLSGIGKTALFDLEKGRSAVRLSTLTAVLETLNITVRFESPLMEEYRAQGPR